jgi:phytoene dehydrogenase-like protein
MKNIQPVVIVGAGVAGLCCALDLKAEGIPVLVLEQADAPGGRVRTDEVNGFRLDRGFQVWLEAYPECQKRLDPEKCQAGAFGSGAVIYDGKALRLFADPFRHPQKAFKSFLHPVGSLGDKLRMQLLRSRVSKKGLEELFSSEDVSTLAHWEALGFSSRMIDGFLAPFFRGIFLAEPEEVSRRMFDFVFSMFGQGRALLPAGGIQRIPESLAEGFSTEELRLSISVKHVSADKVVLTSGEEIAASAVVVTVPQPESLGIDVSEVKTSGRSVACFYFDAPKAPIEGPWLVLNGSGRGQVTQVSVNSSVADGYAPEGRHLISVSANGTTLDTREVKQEMREWFGAQVDAWEILKKYTIDYALPAFVDHEIPGPGWKEVEGVFVCGDAFRHPSLQGAMESGTRVATELCFKKDLHRTS